MFPNKNIPRNHDLIGGEVRNHLVYNGIKTDENGISYYDFTYDGTYSAKYKKVPKTIVNYLVFELAFFRAGFEWGFYYETTCDAMHFMLTENDRNRHMHTDIGLRKVYAYIEPDWVYVPTPSPSPAPERTPKLSARPRPRRHPCRRRHRRNSVCTNIPNGSRQLTKAGIIKLIVPAFLLRIKRRYEYLNCNYFLNLLHRYFVVLRFRIHTMTATAATAAIAETRRISTVDEPT
ncbi:MAG: hypothetical protein R2912_07250 [Eubacteriales bacterium]